MSVDAGGDYHLVAGLRETLTASWASIAEHVIIKTLILLALLEVIRTLQAYLNSDACASRPFWTPPWWC